MTKGMVEEKVKVKVRLRGGDGGGSVSNTYILYIHKHSSLYTLDVYCTTQTYTYY